MDSPILTCAGAAGLSGLRYPPAQIRSKLEVSSAYGDIFSLSPSNTPTYPKGLLVTGPANSLGKVEAILYSVFRTRREENM